MLTVNIEAFVDHLFFHDEYFSNEIVAVYDPKDFSLPTQPVIAKDKERIKSWMVDDFEAFVSDIETLCEVNYNLVLTYTSVSENHSHCYNYLAKDSEGNAIAKFRLRLRISNHSPKRSPSQKHNKKEELMSEKTS